MTTEVPDTDRIGPGDVRPGHRPSSGHRSPEPTDGDRQGGDAHRPVRAWLAATAALLARTWFPLFFGLGLLLSYVGAFHHPDPHGIGVVVDGPPAVTAPAADALRAGGTGLEVAVADRPLPALRAEVAERRVAFVYVPSPALVGARVTGDAPELLVAEAAGPSVLAREEPTFLRLAAAGGRPLSLVDLVADAGSDYNGLGPFYLLIALSLGSYLPVTLLTLARPTVPLAEALAVSAVLGVVTAAVVALAGGPLYAVAAGEGWLLFGVGTWYCLAVVLVGIGLRSLTGAVAPAIVTVVFAILNFPSAGGTLAPSLLPPLFDWCNRVLPGAALVEVVRDAVYFDGAGSGRALRVLGLWLGAGVVLTVGAAVIESVRATSGAGAAVPWRRRDR